MSSGPSDTLPWVESCAALWFHAYVDNDVVVLSFLVVIAERVEVRPLTDKKTGAFRGIAFVDVFTPEGLTMAVHHLPCECNRSFFVLQDWQPA